MMRFTRRDFPFHDPYVDVYSDAELRRQEVHLCKHRIESKHHMTRVLLLRVCGAVFTAGKSFGASGA